MEIKKPAESTSRLSDQDLAICTINIDEIEQESRPSAYTCTFCKRGFSNAQALGGHMNVHRKDRAARLQETTDQTTKGSTTNSMDRGPDDHQSQSSSDDDKAGDGIIPKRPWSSFTEEEEEDSPESHRKKDHAVNFKKPSLQLSLCIEPSSTNESRIISSNKISTSLSSSPTEVDLELRLGIDSQATRLA